MNLGDILLILGYVLSGAVGSFLFAKAWRKEFGIIEGTEIPVILVIFIFGYLGLLIGFYFLIAPYICRFITAHTKWLTEFLNKITE